MLLRDAPKSDEVVAQAAALLRQASQRLGYVVFRNQLRPNQQITHSKSCSDGVLLGTSILVSSIAGHSGRVSSQK